MTDPGPPGVFVVELPATGPIAGVGTSTAAFIGPAGRGPMLTPTQVVNLTQFRSAFGEPLTGGFLAQAVRGFFENGGTRAYVVRVGTATRGELVLQGRGTPTRPAVVVRAVEEGPAGGDITVEVRDDQVVAAGQNCAVARATATATAVSGDRLTFADADAVRPFRAGDVVVLDGVDGRFEVARVEDASLVLATALPASAAAGAVRVADLVAGQRSLRLANPAGIERGSTVRLEQGTTSESGVVAAVARDRITLEEGLGNGYALAGDADPVVVTTLEFTLVVRSGNREEVLERLSMDRRHSRYAFGPARSELVELSRPDPPSTTAPPNDRPKVGDARNLAPGTVDDLDALTLPHFESALEALRAVDDVSIVCVPGQTAADVQQAVIGHCEQLQDRFAVLDSTRGAPPSGTGSVLEQRAGVESQRGFAALYYPWLTAPDPAGGPEPVLVPPSGHIAGIYARSDAERGVHKAPANELVRGAGGLERVLADGEQTPLNMAGVNALRVFAGKARPVVWGARTTAPTEATAFRYVNVRRLMLFIEESIQEGIRWAVFEPNDLGLRKALVRTVTEFLTRVWSSGALFGVTAAEAFYVLCDDELNPPDARELGQLVMEVGVAPVRPAEFVIVRIGVWPGARSDEG